MLAVDVLIPRPARQWQKLLIERLRTAGHDVAIRVSTMPDRWSPTMRAIIPLERALLRRAAGLAETVNLQAEVGSRPCSLRIDLTVAISGPEAPTLMLLFDGVPSEAGAIEALAQGRLPDIDIVLDGLQVDHAAPMVDRRHAVSLGIEDVLARAITLVLKTVARIEQGENLAASARPVVNRTGHSSFGLAYFCSAVPRLGREVVRRLTQPHSQWHVGYRLHDGPGVADTGRLGNGWTVLPDDGSRFFAHPFPFEWQDRRYIFVEDHPHATQKGVLSVSMLDAHGVAGDPVAVLEEPHHLSYPQVFTLGGEIWMLPEAGASGRLTLYRAERFPERWRAAAVLVEGQVRDATLAEHGGLLWLFATSRDSYGSASDTMVVYFAEALTGPWRPHKQNPILIDRTAARPGGAVIRRDDEMLLPVQDGTLGYGCGLGLSRIARLDLDRVELERPRPISAAGDWPYRGFHTLNRAGRLEVIDGIVPLR